MPEEPTPLPQSSPAPGSDPQAPAAGAPAGAPTATRRPRKRRRRQPPVFLEVLIAIGAVILIQLFVAKPFVVPSQSMEETLHIGDRILVNRLDSSIDRFDVVVFSHGTTWAQTRLPEPPSTAERWSRNVGDVIGIIQSNSDYTVKRVIGQPGEKVACCDPQGHVLVNGEAISEPWIFQDYPFTPGRLDCRTDTRSMRCFPEIRVPEEHYLVLGDHRSQSADSVESCRTLTEANGCAKFVPASRVVGPVVLKIWPLDRLGTLG